MTQSRVSATKVASQELEQDRDLGHLIDERPPWMCEADRYVSWYEGVEGTIVLLLKRVGVEVDPGRTPEGHAFHENVLKELQRRNNFYHDALGSGKVYETLSQAKAFRNIWRKNVITKSRRACLPYLNSISSQRMVVEDGLLTAFRILGTNCFALGIKMIQQTRNDQQQVDKRRENLEGLKESFNKRFALREKAVFAEQEKTSEWFMSRDHGNLERERMIYNEYVRTITANLDKRSAEIAKVFSSLERAFQAHRAVVGEAEELSLANMCFDMEIHVNAKNVESQPQIEHNRMMELQRKLDTKTAELKRLQDKEANRKDDPSIPHEELCAILYRHRRSQNPQELLIVFGEGTEDGSKILAAMLRDLLKSHARVVNEAKVAKNRHRKLQEENELLEQRLAKVEAQNSTDRLVVETALSRMADSVDSGVRMLKSFFTKQETRRESGNQRESSTSK